MDSMRGAGTYLGFLVVATRLAIQRVHGPGGQLEGYPADWGLSFCLAAYQAKVYVEKWNEERHG